MNVNLEFCLVINKFVSGLVVIDGEVVKLWHQLCLILCSYRRSADYSISKSWKSTPLCAKEVNSCFKVTELNIFFWLSVGLGCNWIPVYHVGCIDHAACYARLTSCWALSTVVCSHYLIFWLNLKMGINNVGWFAI